MKLKGAWDSGTSYSVGDVVQFTDGDVFVLREPCAAGTEPIDTLYWSKVSSPLKEAVSMIIDAIGIAGEAATAGIEKYFLNDQTLILKTGEEGSEKSYAVTVDDSGDTPDVVAEEIVEEDEGEGT